MSSFLYFTEQGNHPVQLADAQGWGLGYAFGANPASMEIQGRTPTGGKGWLFTDQERLGEAFLGYNANIQEWRKIPNSELWVGYDKVKRPTPKSLAREKQMPGGVVRFADGQDWLVPQLRYFANEAGFRSSLPVHADLNDAGEWVVGEVCGYAKSFDAIADRLLAGMIDSLAVEGIEPLTTVELLDAACALLEANYVVSKTEIVMLGLLTADELLMQVARVATDFETAMEWAVKKNEASESLAVAG